MLIMLTPEDVLAFEKTVTDKKTYRRFLCIKLKIIDSKKQAEISLLDQHKGKVGIYDLHQALNAIVGRIVPVQSIYNLFKRHGWKAKVPRPVHPKHNEQAQTLFKKTS
jgi:hypothetical protein